MENVTDMARSVSARLLEEHYGLSVSLSDSESYCAAGVTPPRRVADGHFYSHHDVCGSQSLRGGSLAAGAGSGGGYGGRSMTAACGPAASPGRAFSQNAQTVAQLFENKGRRH